MGIQSGNGAPQWFSEGWGCKLLAWRRTALVALLFFVLQFTRFYLVVQLDETICAHRVAELNQAAASTTAHHHSHEAEQLVPHEHDNGFYFQHCKETFEGISLTPVQPLGAPMAVSLQRLEWSWQPLVKENFPAPERYLPSPFHPPRKLG